MRAWARPLLTSVTLGVLVGCGAEAPLDPTMPAPASSAPGNTAAFLLGERLREADIPPIVREAVGAGLTWRTAADHTAVVAEGVRVGWPSLARSQVFADAWATLGRDATAAGSPAIGFVDFQILIELVRARLREEGGLASMGGGAVENALGLPSLRYLAFAADSGRSNVVGLLASTGAAFGVTAWFARDVGAARALLAPAAADADQLALDVHLDADGLAASLALLIDPEQPALGAVAAMLQSFADPLRDAVAVVAGPVSVRASPDGVRAAVALRAIEPAERILDRLASEDDQDGWEWGPVHFRLVDARKLLLAWTGDRPPQPIDDGVPFGETAVHGWMRGPVGDARLAIKRKKTGLGFELKYIEKTVAPK